MEPYQLPDETHPGPLRLVVADLSAQRRFYEQLLGLQPLWEATDELLLGTDARPLLHLSARRGAKRPTEPHTGLFHFALLFPSRALLGAALRRLLAQGYPLEGASDHWVSEALYLSDPEGNGIELYHDRPREQWPMQGGKPQMTTLPLNLRALLADAAPPASEIPAGTTVGHMHLRVAALNEAERFYSETVGLEPMLRFGRSAGFLAAGGYHHHLGINTWSSAGATPPPDGSSGLRYWSLLLPSQPALATLRAHLAASGAPYQEEGALLRLRDPSHNELLLLAEEALPTLRDASL